MKNWKRLIAAALTLCTLGALASCGNKGLSEKDAETYVKGHLDAAYLGTYAQDYIDLVEDMTEAEAKSMHEDNVEIEVEQYLLPYLEVEYPTDEITQKAADVMEAIYSKAQYKIGSATKTKDGDFAVEVTVSPIEVLNLLTSDDFFNALEESGYYDAETQEELEAADAVYGMLALDLVEDLIGQITYGEDQIIMLQLKPDDEGYYTLVDTGIQKVDEVIIDYNGSYTK